MDVAQILLKNRRELSAGGSTPVRRWKNDRPELGIGLVELERHRIKIRGSVFHPNDAADLLDFVLRVYEPHGLADVNFHFQLQQTAMSVDDQRQGFFLARMVFDVFGDHRDSHLQHHAFAAPAVNRIFGRGHEGLRDSFRTRCILP